MPDILHRIGVAAEQMRVFEALTTVEGIRNWWAEDTHGDAAEGGAFQFRRNRLQVMHADPSLVTWRYSGPAEEWVGTEITFRLEWATGRPSCFSSTPIGASRWSSCTTAAPSGRRSCSASGTTSSRAKVDPSPATPRSPS